MDRHRQTHDLGACKKHAVVVMPPPLISGGIKRWCTSDVWPLSVCRVHRA